MRHVIGALGALLALSAQPAVAQQPVQADAAAQTAPASMWVTLGTQGGPVPNATRSQPANLLLVGGEAYLVDAGDGTAGQLARIGVPLQQLRAIFISHLHFDHMAGLAAILGLRFQTETQGVLTVYGPPGTRQMVDGLVASMVSAGIAGYGVPGEEVHDPSRGVAVVEWRGGEDVTIGSMRVRNVVNSHYSFTPDSPQYGNFASLSYRFDLPDRAILYTGDTGPSADVDALGQDVDLLVAEMIDVEALLSGMGMRREGQAGGPVPVLIQHLANHHLTARQVGEMARAMRARQVVVTHLVAGMPTQQALRRYVAEIGEVFAGPVTIARDLDGF